MGFELTTLMYGQNHVGIQAETGRGLLKTTGRQNFGPECLFEVDINHGDLWLRPAPGLRVWDLSPQGVL